MNATSAEAWTEVWTLLHQATANYLYHGDRAATLATWNATMRIGGILLMILGLAFAMWPTPTKETAQQRSNRIKSGHMTGLVLTILGVILQASILPVLHAQHASLRGDWLAMKGELEGMREEIRNLADDDRISDKMAAALDSIRQRKNALFARETSRPPLDADLTRYWEEANEKLYGYGVRTAAEAEAHLQRLREARAEKKRAPGDS